jgi:hypothetical protein
MSIPFAAVNIPATSRIPVVVAGLSGVAPLANIAPLTKLEVVGLL